MRWVPVVALVVVGCGSGADDETPIRPQDGSFDALSYNVAGLPQGLSSSNPEANIPQISPMLNGFDLVLAQEDFAYHELLVADAEHPFQSLPKEHHIQLVDDGLNRFSEFDWDGFERVQWVSCYGDANSGASDCLAEKGFSWARTTFGDRVTIDVVNLHGEAGGGAEDIAARAEGYAQLIAYLADKSAGRALIVAGDTNLHRSDPEDLVLLTQIEDELGLVDACEALACGEDHIDRFFFRSNGDVSVDAVSWRNAVEFVDAAGDPLSDHPAIHVGFAWSTR
jgi:hypothetical protein